MRDEDKSLNALRCFLRWTKNEHPDIIKEYVDLLNQTIKELEEIEKLKAKDNKNF